MTGFFAVHRSLLSFCAAMRRQRFNPPFSFRKDYARRRVPRQPPAGRLLAEVNGPLTVQKKRGLFVMGCGGPTGRQRLRYARGGSVGSY